MAQGWNGDRADDRAFPRPLGRRPLCARVGARWRSVKAGTPLVDRAAPPVSRDQSLSRRRCGKTRRRRLRRRGERNLKKRNTNTLLRSSRRYGCNGHCAARGVERRWPGASPRVLLAPLLIARRTNGTETDGGKKARWDSPVNLARRVVALL